MSKKEKTKDDDHNFKNSVASMIHKLDSGQRAIKMALINTYGSSKSNKRKKRTKSLKGVYGLGMRNPMDK
tara:strand:- start:86 stop:295 length:210 start_codon:yes stop_codon:yes gene_type:complete